MHGNGVERCSHIVTYGRDVSDLYLGEMVCFGGRRPYCIPVHEPRRGTGCQYGTKAYEHWRLSPQSLREWVFWILICLHGAFSRGINTTPYTHYINDVS